MVDLVGAISIDVEGADTHDVFAAPALKVGFIDSYENPDRSANRVERLNLRPNLIKGAMENLCVAVITISEKLEGEFVRIRIEKGEIFSRHSLVVRRCCDCEI